MPRIQILSLPLVERGDGTHDQPFALVVDEAGATEVEFDVSWSEFGQQVGARSVLVTSERVEIVDSPAGEDAPLVEFDHAALADSFATALRFHLESGEASDALRAWCERRAATARDGR